MYENILFDLDNTLLDFDSAEENSIKKVFEIYGVEFNTINLEKYRTINIKMWSELEKGNLTKDEVLTKRFEEFFSLFNILVNPREVENVFRSYLDSNCQLIEGATKLLQELKKSGKRIFTASNGVYNTQIRRMTDSGIIGYFDKHFISEKIGYEKPNVLFFKHCYDNIEGATLNNTIMVGDRVASDIIGAKNFGFDTCYFNRNGNGEKEATYNVNELSQIIKII